MSSTRSKRYIADSAKQATLIFIYLLNCVLLPRFVPHADALTHICVGHDPYKQVYATPYVRVYVYALHCEFAHAWACYVLIREGTSVETHCSFQKLAVSASALVADSETIVNFCGRTSA